MQTRPWMIEASYEYIKVARIAYENRLYNPSLVLAALGLEILFKSFNAETGNVLGGIGETYVFDKNKVGLKGHGHNLLDLFNSISPNIKEMLGFEKHREDFENYYQEPFVIARYPYEDGAPGSYSDDIIEIAEKMVNRVIKEYQNLGCQDPWIVEKEAIC